LGVLHWPPKDFWRATMCELMAANKGYLRATKPPEKDPMNRTEYEALKERLDKTKTT